MFPALILLLLSSFLLFVSLKGHRTPYGVVMKFWHTEREQISELRVQEFEIMEKHQFTFAICQSVQMHPGVISVYILFALIDRCICMHNAIHTCNKKFSQNLWQNKISARYCLQVYNRRLILLNKSWSTSLRDVESIVSKTSLITFSGKYYQYVLAVFSLFKERIAHRFFLSIKWNFTIAIRHAIRFPTA